MRQLSCDQWERDCYKTFGMFPLWPCGVLQQRLPAGSLEGWPQAALHRESGPSAKAAPYAEY